MGDAKVGNQRVIGRKLTFFLVMVESQVDVYQPK
jgi:hypothetical protein